jgi:heme oxygenase
MPQVTEFPSIDPLVSRSESLVAFSTAPLSFQLREGTAALHREVESKLGLPDTITTLADYRRCLQSFYQLYRPVERSFTRFTDWASNGLDLSVRVHSVRLAADLEALGIAPLDLEDAPRSSQPILPDFAHALGVMYVIEGSTLGSQFILPHLIKVLGKQIVGADSFFLGRGTETGALWGAFRTSLDNYGMAHPEKIADVIQGAQSTFEAIGLWMQP